MNQEKAVVCVCVRSVGGIAWIFMLVEIGWWQGQRGKIVTVRGVRETEGREKHWSSVIYNLLKSE